jgi:hypothetical protein
MSSPNIFPNMLKAVLQSDNVCILGSNDRRAALPASGGDGVHSSRAAARFESSCVPGRNCALDRACDLDPRGNRELAEDVVQMGFHRLRAEEEGVGDLRVRPAIDDEPGDLKLSLRQGLDADGIRFAGPRASVDSMAKAAQLALGRGAVSQSTAGV